MTSRKRIQIIELIFFYIFSLLFLLAPSVKAEKIISEKYLVSFKTNKSTCLLRINDFPAIDSTTADFGTMSAGYNTTAFVENGKNKIELLMGPQDHSDPKTLFSDSFCQVVISKDTKNDNLEIARYILSVNSKGDITAGKSSNYNRNEVSDKIFEGYTKKANDYGLYKLECNFFIKGLPKWSWSDATPVTESDLPKIKKAYEDIWVMMKNRDIEGLKKITKVSNEEMAFSEGTSPGMMFASSGFPGYVIDSEYTPVPIEWSEYDLETYRDGRLFRMAAGFFQNSPLSFKDHEGNIVFTYNPYFSSINGKITLVR